MALEPVSLSCRNGHSNGGNGNGDAVSDTCHGDRRSPVWPASYASDHVPWAIWPTPSYAHGSSSDTHLVMYYYTESQTARENLSFFLHVAMWPLLNDARYTILPTHLHLHYAR